jgi:exosome complex RNA-binding protein Rrp4
MTLTNNGKIYVETESNKKEKVLNKRTREKKRDFSREVS